MNNNQLQSEIMLSLSQIDKIYSSGQFFETNQISCQEVAIINSNDNNEEQQESQNDMDKTCSFAHFEELAEIQQESEQPLSKDHIEANHLDTNDPVNQTKQNDLKQSLTLSLVSTSADTKDINNMVISKNINNMSILNKRLVNDKELNITPLIENVLKAYSPVTQCNFDDISNDCSIKLEFFTSSKKSNQLQKSLNKNGADDELSLIACDGMIFDQNTSNNVNVCIENEKNTKINEILIKSSVQNVTPNLFVEKHTLEKIHAAGLDNKNYDDSQYNLSQAAIYAKIVDNFNGSKSKNFDKFDLMNHSNLKETYLNDEKNKENHPPLLAIPKVHESLSKKQGISSSMKHDIENLVMNALNDLNQKGSGLKARTIEDISNRSIQKNSVNGLKSPNLLKSNKIDEKHLQEKSISKVSLFITDHDEKKDSKVDNIEILINDEKINPIIAGKSEGKQSAEKELQMISNHSENKEDLITIQSQSTLMESQSLNIKNNQDTKIELNLEFISLENNGLFEDQNQKKCLIPNEKQTEIQNKNEFLSELIGEKNDNDSKSNISVDKQANSTINPCDPNDVIKNLQFNQVNHNDKNNVMKKLAQNTNCSRKSAINKRKSKLFKKISKTKKNKKLVRTVILIKKGKMFKTRSSLSINDCCNTSWQLDNNDLISSTKANSTTLNTTDNYIKNENQNSPVFCTKPKELNQQLVQINYHDELMPKSLGNEVNIGDCKSNQGENGIISSASNHLNLESLRTDTTPNCHSSTSLTQKQDIITDIQNKPHHDMIHRSLTMDSTSDIFELDSKYRKKDETPISKTFRHSLTTVNDLQLTIQESLKNFKNKLNMAKSSLLAVQPAFDYDRITVNSIHVDPSASYLDTLIRESNTNNYSPKSAKIEKSSIIKFTKKSPFLSKKSINKTPISAMKIATISKDIENTKYLLKDIFKDLDTEAEDLKNFDSDNIIKDRMLIEYGHTNINNDELNIIKHIINGQSCLYRYTNIQNKSIVYQLASIFANGLVVYINPSITYIVNELENLPRNLSGACINSLINGDQIQKIIEYAKLDNIKILFITPEKFIQEYCNNKNNNQNCNQDNNHNLFDIYNISFICLDETQYYLQDTSSHIISSLSNAISAINAASILSSNGNNGNKTYNTMNIYEQLIDIINKKYKNIPLLSFIGPNTLHNTLEICQLLNIPSSLIYPKKYKISKPEYDNNTINTNTNIYNQSLSLTLMPNDNQYGISNNIRILRDEDKLKSLLYILRNNTKESANSIIIYCDTRKTIDNISIQLTKHGYKHYICHHLKNDLQKFEILNGFLKNKGSILISLINSDITGIHKNLIKTCIHYNMPKNLETYIQEISGLTNTSQCYLFVNDEEYHTMRLNIYSNMINIYQINKFIEKIFEMRNDNAKDIHMKNMKNTPIIGNFSTMMNNNQFYNMGFSNTSNKFLKPNTNNITSIINFDNKNSHKFSIDKNGLANTDKISTNNLNKNQPHMQINNGEVMYSLNVNTVCKNLNLKKELVTDLFQKFEKYTDWIRYLGTNPINYNVMFLHSKPETLTTNSILIKAILNKNRKLSSICKFSIIDISNEVGLTTNEIIKILKTLQQENILNFEVSEEAFCFKLINEPSPMSLVQKANEIYDILQKKNMICLNKLDLMYSLCKLSSFSSIDQLYKQFRYENTKVMKNSLTGSTTASLFTSMGNQLDDTNQGSMILKDKRKEKVNIFDYFEHYLNYEGEGNQAYDILLEENNQNIRDIIPIIKIITQRDKSNILVDLNELITQYYEELISNDSTYLDHGLLETSLLIKEMIANNVVKIMQGIYYSHNLNEWKINKYWGKYSKYDFKELKSIALEVISAQNFLINHKRKKIKLN